MGIMGRPELAEGDRFLNRASRIENASEVNTVIAQWTANVGKNEIYSLVAPSGCPVGLYADSQDLRNSPQLQARQFFQEVDHPQAGQLTYPVRPYQFTGLPQSAPDAPPLLGQHNQEVFCGDLGLTLGELSELKTKGVI